MRLDTYHRLLKTTQGISLIGLALAVVWNMLSLSFDLRSPAWWVGMLLPLPGVSAWMGTLAAPICLARLRPIARRWYRLTYDAPVGWLDDTARAALLNLARADNGLELIWARGAEGLGCWLAAAGNSTVLPRLISDVFPSGSLEEDQPPPVGVGVVLLSCNDQLMPAPNVLGQTSGIDGIYIHWLNDRSAVVAIWGPSAEPMIHQYAVNGGLLSGRGDALRRSRFVGHNPWPSFPPFPPSQGQPGLAAISPLTIPAPTLRVKVNEPALLLGLDPDRQPVGFPCPQLAGLQPLQIFGQSAEMVALNLVGQAIQAGQPVLWLDGRGAATGRLTRRFVRELASGQLLLCDVERPAQSQFRLNPLWLPDDSHSWSTILVEGWSAWLRDLGVTPGGLGHAAYRHTLVAVMLTGLLGARQGLALDITSLKETLAAPDFLPMVGAETPFKNELPSELWDWWLSTGRHTPNFDMHVRLGHLRGRLKVLLDIPEYRVLWQPPYLDPLIHLMEGKCLCWRLPDPRQRLRVYLTSQLLALTTLLTLWPPHRPPLLIFLHEIEAGPWLARLNAYPAARPIISAAAIPRKIFTEEPASLLLSRLSTPDARRIQAELPGVRAADLSRLPLDRLVLKRGAVIGTVGLSAV